MPIIHASEIPPGELYKLFVGSVQPRPIALVSTISADGHLNLAPYSFFNVASVNPPVLSFSAQLAQTKGSEMGQSKDTLTNIRETRECVINIVSYAMREQMNICAAPWPRDVDEFLRSGFSPVPSHTVRPPRVGEAQVAFECRLDQIISWGDQPRSGNLVLVRVETLVIHDAVYRDGKIDAQALDTIGRLGGPTYTRSREGLFHMEQPMEDWVRRAMEVHAPEDRERSNSE